MARTIYSLLGLAVLAAQTAAQVASYANSNRGISVNVPSDTASSGSGPIYFQISAPGGTQWVSFGQGTRMAGSNMFVVYAKDDSSVTVSPRLGTGHSTPQFNSDAQITLLDGSGIASDGTMVANVRCDNCLSWTGGSMSATSSSSNWIVAWKEGDALNSDDTDANIGQHDSHSSFQLDLTTGTGGSSSNPFASSSGASSSSSATASSGTASETASETASATGTRTSASATTSSTNGVSNPVVSSSPGSTSSSSGSTTVNTSSTAGLRNAHGIIMSILFVALFPLASLTLYLPYAQKVRFVHAPMQGLGVVLLIVGMALGISLGTKINELDGYHMVIGFIVVAVLILFQPAMGVYQHLYYRRTGGRSAFGVSHRWLGRAAIALGVVNGGLGFMISGTTSAYVPYAVVAALVFLLYISVVVFGNLRSKQQTLIHSEKDTPRTNVGYEMQIPKGQRHSRIPSDPHPNFTEQPQYR